MKLSNRQETRRATVDVPVVDVNGPDKQTKLDTLAIEEPLEIRVARRAVSVTMRTPGDDENLAVGFLFGEGLIQHADQLSSIEAGPNSVDIQLANEVGFEFGRLKRSFYTTSSCGVCGKASIEALDVVNARPIEDDLDVDAGVIRSLPAKIAHEQRVFRSTGGLHAAAFFDLDGAIDGIAEDVGRHNALDKLIGARVRAGRIPAARRILLLSGRASFELIQKALLAQVPIVAAVGAPSSLAVELAARYEMTLIGFLRHSRFNVYTRPNRVRLPA